MNCAELKEQAAAYALGALTPDERAACDAHLATAAHDGCFEALALAFDTAGDLASSLPPSRPSAKVWDAIAAETAPRGATASSPRASWVPWLLAAAAVALVIWMGLSRGQLERRLAEARRGADRVVTAEAARRTCEQDLSSVRGELELRERAVAMLALPSGRVVALAPQAGSPPSLRATAVVDVAGRRAMLVVSGLATPPGKDFELWVIKGNEKRAAGLLRGVAGGSLVTALDPALLADGADALAITFEPAGGGPQPRGPAVLVGALPKS